MHRRAPRTGTERIGPKIQSVRNPVVIPQIGHADVAYWRRYLQRLSLGYPLAVILNDEALSAHTMQEEPSKSSSEGDYHA